MVLNKIPYCKYCMAFLNSSITVYYIILYYESKIYTATSLRCMHIRNQTCTLVRNKNSNKYYLIWHLIRTTWYILHLARTTWYNMTLRGCQQDSLYYFWFKIAPMVARPQKYEKFFFPYNWKRFFRHRFEAKHDPITNNLRLRNRKLKLKFTLP